MADAEDQAGIRLAVYGATGALGRQVLVALEGYGLPIDHLVAVGGPESAGREAHWRGRPITVVGDHLVDIADLDVAALAVPPQVAETLRGTLIDAGIFVVDLSASGGEGALPLLWPSLDLSPVETHPGGVALPCGVAGALAPLMAALAPLGAVEALDVTALMSAQSVGRRGEEALSSQTVALLNQRLATPGPFGGVLAFNLLPGSHEAVAAADPVVERSIEQLLRLVPSLSGVAISLRVVQVPVFAGLGQVVQVRFASPPERDALAACLDASEELRPIPDEGRLALRDTMEHDAVFLARPHLRDDGVFEAFVATDPLHRSAWALGAVLEHVLAEDLW